MKAARDEFYKQDALPFEKAYADAETDEEITLPLTRAGFELLLTEVCGRFELPADDGCRSTLAGYVHHIPPDKHETTLQDLGVILHKSISNAMTWQVDQDVKKAKQEADAAEAKAKEESTPLSLVGDSSDVPTTPQGA